MDKRLRSEKPLKYSIRSCLSKKRYSSEGLADNVAKKVYKERQVELRSYYCMSCAGFHLTSKEKRNVRS